MKVKNRAIGSVCELVAHGAGKYITEFAVESEDGSEIATYSTIEELLEYWETYKPAEPLIKDEQIRKAVRAWAEAFNVDVAYLAPIGDGSKFVELFNEDSDGFERIAIPAENIKQEQCYTIAELCGEEEK